jgi:hypothetical protein
MKSYISKFLVFAMVLGWNFSAAQAQTPQREETPVQNAQVAQDPALSQRAAAYYKDLVDGESATAFEFVAPQSKNDFFKMHTDGLVAAQILGIELPSEPGGMAKVKVQKSIKPPQFAATLDFQYVETWKQIDGQWYIVLPNFKDTDSPFGAMRFNQQGKNGSGASVPAAATGNVSPDLAEIQKKAETNAKNADPDQYLMALKRAMDQQAQAQKPKTPPADDKKKTDQTDPKPKQ